MAARIICIGAHPDDCEYFFGGTAALLIRAGHSVKFVSVTNGDAGHPTLSGPELAARRKSEAEASAAYLGVESYTILTHRDGRLQPSLEARESVIRLMRSFRADVVLTHRPWDYHPDHRATSTLVMDAMTLLAIPSIAPDVAPILTQKNPPVLLYLFDRFTKPLKFEPDLIVDISGSYEDKISALERHESQVFEFVYGPCPHPASKPRERKEWLKTMAEGEIGAPGKKFRKEIEDAYGKELRYAEAFEVSEYGGRLTDEVKKRIFPFVPLAGKGKARM